MPKKLLTKVSDKLTKVSECVNVYFYDNAYMVEVTGRDDNDDWSNIKLVCKDLNEVVKVLEDVESLPRES
jgi:hypothetical protein